jgi:hypothetical protein
LAFLFVPESRHSDTKHEAGERIVMAPKKAPKKGEEQPEGDIISDTTAAGVIHNIKSWATIADKMEGELSYSDDDGENYLRNIASTGLHKAAARPKLVSYTDMVVWALDKVDVPTRSILNEQGEVAGSFRPEHIQVMYKLSPNHKHTLNSEFLAAFQQKECYEGGQSYPDMIKEWVRDKNKFRADANGIYATASLNDYMRYLVMMLCRLYGKKDSNHFSAEWTPLLEEVSEGNSFNWHKILSDNITTEVTNYKTAREKGQFVAFYMSAYIMDAICFRTPFPLMSWSWNPSCTEPVHIYHSTLWEDHAKDSFYEICHFVIIPLHKIFFGFEPPRISHAIIENLKIVADWFIEEHFSYVRVYGCSIPPHALPKILPDRLICREVAYQLVNGGIGNELKAQQKKSWPYFPVYLGKFALLNFGHSKVEAESLSEIKLVDIEHRKYDPYQIIYKHVAQCGLKAYEHEESFYDDVFRNAKSYDEVQSKVQTLSPDVQVGFASFQRNRRQCLPKILQGEISTSEHESESIPPGFETIIQYDASSKDKPKDSEALPQNTEDPQSKEAKAVRDSFQKVLSALQEKEIRQSQKLSISEQLKGDVMLKVWETKLKEYKGITEEVINDCQRIFGSINKDSIQDETNGLPESLGETNINDHQLKIREEFEEKKMEISNVKAVNISEIEKWMIGPSSILEKIKSTEKEIANQLPGLQRSFFSLEANEVPEVPKALVNFLERHIQTTEADRRSFPFQN